MLHCLLFGLLGFSGPLSALDSCRQNKNANPPKLHQVWFDDIVVATEDIGPIHRTL